MTNAYATTDRTIYGATETNGLVNGSAYHNSVDYSDVHSLKMLEQAGGKITRLRLLTEYVPTARVRMVDVSYCIGTLPNGKNVPVQVYLSNSTTRTLKGDLIALAKAEGVFAKKLGLLDEANWSMLK